VNIELSPSGIGTDRVLASWKSFARHTAMPCEDCLPLLKAVSCRPGTPAHLVNACCQQGQALAAAWIDACADLVEHFKALSRA
jgi:hypothetical protein